MSDEFLNNQAKEALRLRTRGHTYAYIGEKLNLTPGQAKNIIQDEAERSFLYSGVDGEIITEVTIRLTTPANNMRAPALIRELVEKLYETEAEWERGFATEESASDPILTEPTTFSVSRVIVNNAPQTGKSVIFPEV